MKILVINSDYLPFELKKLAQWFADHSIFLLTPSTIAPRLRKELMGIFTHIFDYSNSDKLFLVADEAHREKCFDCVIGHVEPDLLPAAQLRQLWGMKGACYESILAYRDKAVMKTNASNQRDCCAKIYRS